jgi:tetratricopeptide (TPR) repeat protein
MVRNAVWISIVALQIVILWMAPSLLSRSDLDICAGGDADAEQACRRVLAQGKWTARQKASAHLRLADLVGFDIERAVDHRAEALALDPSSTDPRLVGRLAHDLGAARLSQGNHESALKYLSLAIRIDPKNDIALSDRARLHGGQNRHDLALDDWRKALQLQPNNTTYRSGIASAYFARGIAYMSSRNVEPAISDLTSAIQFDPRLPNAHAQRAAALLAKGDHISALSDLNQALQYAPGDISVRLLRASAYEKASRINDAIADYRYVLSREPGHRRAQGEFERLQRQVASAAPPPPQPPPPPALSPPANDPKVSAEQPPRPPIAPPAPAAPPPMAVYANHDLSGTDLRHTTGIEQQACLAACQSEPVCLAAVYDKWNRWCFLKNAVVKMRYDPKYTAATRPYVPKPPEADSPLVVERFRRRAFPPSQGDVVRRAGSFDECAQRCRDSRSCAALTFSAQTEDCRLIENPGEYFPNETTDAGVKRQLYGQ